LVIDITDIVLKQYFLQKNIQGIIILHSNYWPFVVGCCDTIRWLYLYYALDWICKNIRHTFIHVFEQSNSVLLVFVKKDNRGKL
jgi:hypothetical protein